VLKEGAPAAWRASTGKGTDKLGDKVVGDMDVLIEDYTDMIEEANVIRDVAKETLGLLLSMTSIFTGRIAQNQSNEVHGLTRLAFVYIPISFVCSFFGMNLKELNDSGARMWIFWVTTVAIVLTTFLAKALMKEEGVRRSRHH
jgi:Mg2+ and Co2+ transporter CorA